MRIYFYQWVSSTKIYFTILMCTFYRRIDWRAEQQCQCTKAQWKINYPHLHFKWRMMVLLPLPRLQQHRNIMYKIDSVKNVPQNSTELLFIFLRSLFFAAAAAADLWQLLKRIVHMCVPFSFLISFFRTTALLSLCRTCLFLWNMNLALSIQWCWAAYAWLVVCDCDIF